MTINYHIAEYRPLNGLILRSTIKNAKRNQTSSIQKGDKRMKILAIVGAGKGLGLSLAKRFGKEGFQVALIARNAVKLQEMEDELKAAGIEASSFTADIYSKEQIEQAITGIKAKYGKIDVLEFSPTPGNFPPTSVLELTVENARDQFEGYVVSAINVVNAVLPDMLARKEGSLLFTTGLSAMYPVPMMGNIGIAMSGLRNYIANLHSELSPKGIFVSHRSLGLFMKETGAGTFDDPDVIANMWYQAYVEKNVWEEEYPKGVSPQTVVF
ncbi:SDR family NAD(P)-dependent oxidoreductase [Paenibacillus kribbensis]|uniref:SDR family NAD(P)-dependent oxidoreductase n=1 Tax=Paenibacillus kribbensis TaxID=172713 RepID=UPI002DBF6ED0|nr:SDR family NAD(P)-dependent oxidoreductase [Paenibacillus kribbensis]MEC0236915.1 SDR family NAD(P)-dependent oxidoreductase [Paenibacillus kribbensis]